MVVLSRIVVISIDNMRTILYLHGFASCGVGNKSTTLKKYFGENNVLCPDLDPSPNKAIESIETLLEDLDDVLLIGSSLGGFYATYLAEKFGLKAVLINPSTQPWKTLVSYVGMQKRFCDNVPFDFKEKYLEALIPLAVEPKNGQYLLLLQSADEVLDYTKAQSLYNKHRVVIEVGGNHRFENIDDYLSMIENFDSKL
ncbi:MAG: Putative esterase, FIGfam005057 [uncultured Sulfurovum sp.]|uniref:Esterase, FIGfam005057 n=1 Tax=uncultured Sulfurovum sp. TaxID=269237 RepID=A0A6S6S5Y9_9BACT|nr:MAG: Putative esterase, FIGfam005057 [uncultured Sulfurovum sp.]